MKRPNSDDCLTWAFRVAIKKTLKTHETPIDSPDNDEEKSLSNAGK